MITDTPLHDLIKHTSRATDKLYGENGKILPMYHIVMHDGSHSIVSSPHHDKDAATTMMRAYFEITPTRRYVFVAEAWTAEYPQEPTQPIIMPSQHPDRIEIIMFLGEDRDIGMLSASRRIIRPPNGKPHLGPLEFNDITGATMEGRMVGLLPRDHREMHS